MSKTLGNVIDPLDTIAEYGTDALRFTLALGTAGQVCYELILSLNHGYAYSFFCNGVHFGCFHQPAYLFVIGSKFVHGEVDL